MILGHGSHGKQLAEILSEEGHDLTIIEQDCQRYEEATEKLDALTFLGSATNIDILLEAEVDKMDVVVAFTDHDDVNIISCLIAKEHGVPKTIARINDEEYYKSLNRYSHQKLGIDYCINPELAVVDEICTMVKYLNAAEAVEFVKGEVVYLAYHIKPESPVVGRSIIQLYEETFEYRFILLGLTRNNEMILPKYEDLIQENDTISFICRHSDIENISKVFGHIESNAHSIFLLGGGKVGLNVAKRLSSQHEVKVMDVSRNRCDFLAQELPEVLVLCTDNTDGETLREEGIEDSDIYLAMTGDDQSNILGALLAKRCGAKRAIAVVGRPDLVRLAYSLGITSCVNPRYVTSNLVLENIMGETVYNISRLQETDAEVIDFKVSKESKVIDKKLKELDIPRGIKIGAIIRNGDVIIPMGDDILQAQDHVIILSTIHDVQKVEEIFSNNH